MKILVVTQYYFPEIGAASKRLTELTRLWVENGHKVSVITAIPNYPFGKVYEGYNNIESIVEEIEGVTVFRNKINVSGRKDKVGRIITYLSFMYNCMKNYKKINGEYDVVITTIGPVFSGVIGQYISKKIKSPHIIEFRDITFKQMQATDYGSKLTVGIMKKLELFLAHNSNHVVTVTNSYKNILEKEGISDNITCIPNGFLENNLTNLDSKNVNKYNNILSKIKKERLLSRKVIGYFGTLGVSQKIEEFVKGFSKIEGYTLLIIGNGAKEKEIKNYLQQNNVDNILIYSSIEQEFINKLYSEVDYNLVKIINKNEFAATIPSKLFEIIGNEGIPLFIGPEGEASKIIEMFSESLTFRNDEELFVNISRKNFKHLKIEEIKAKAKNIISEKYNRRKHAEDYLKVIENTIRE